MDRAEFECELECVTLVERPGHAASARPPVRIFLVSDASGMGRAGRSQLGAHARAERLFVWSIEQVRDPTRRYEIHLLRGEVSAKLAIDSGRHDFERFAVPLLAGGEGRALCNEIGQLYLEDPARLFDRELADAAWLCGDEDDDAPLLLDCGRLGEVWDQNALRSADASKLLERARAAGLRGGQLDNDGSPHSEARFDPERTRLVHLRLLHALPWRPFPERCVYHASPLAELWQRLESAADASGFELFSAGCPSRGDRSAEANLPALREAELEADRRELAQLADDSGIGTGIDCSAGFELSDTFATQGVDVQRVPLEELASRQGGPAADAVVCLDALHQLPADDLPWAIRALFAAAARRLHVGVRCGPEGSGEAERWRRQFEVVSAAFPGVRWSLRMVDDSRRGRAEVRRFEGGAWLGEAPPRVWVLIDDRPGNATQSIGLVEALAWPHELKTLAPRAWAALNNRLIGASLFGIDRVRSDALEPPWPDLVITTGRRTAPVASWIREQSGGLTRLVVLGRKAGDDAALFDLSVTPEYTRCMSHPRRQETSAPLHRMTRAVIEAARSEWKDSKLARAPSPRIAVLVGGSSGQYWMDAEAGGRLGRDLAALADRLGASLWISTSRRTGAAATDALAAALRAERGEVDELHRWSAGEESNPYRALLAYADAFVITGDSESMLLEACFTGRPVCIYPLPIRPSFYFFRFFRERVVRRSRRESRRRDPAHPQDPLARLASWSIARGFVRPTRDFRLFHRSLVERGVACHFGDELERGDAPPLDEVAEVADRVRRLMGVSK